MNAAPLLGRDVECVQENVELELLELRIADVAQEMRFPRRADESQLPLFLRREQRVEQRFAIAAIHEPRFIQHNADFCDGSSIGIERLPVNSAQIGKELDDLVVMERAAEELCP